MAAQLTLQSSGHGGVRRNAGRKKTSTCIPHSPRKPVSSKTPVHITVRLTPGIATLRSKKTFKIFARGVKNAKALGLRILHFAVLGNHFHVIAEADDQKTLASGMRSLNGTIAKAFVTETTRQIFTARYHSEILNTPTQVKNALLYVLTNAAKHFRRSYAADEYSSLATFKGLQILCRFRPHLDWTVSSANELLNGVQLSQPRSWLASVGWRKACF